ncbi:slit homolog 2 protein-like [Argiope bruennichi]|uniref:slit homolog 2 protein-like n=1 Tax=Argiope bruennichi TaxID=94029 RepID=UPI0024954462|nr:slit homolog 2 protein-like [Argiope bruennichi]
MLPRPANKLKRLELDNNALKSVPDDLFLDMPELKLLSLNYNGIVHLPEKAFRPIWSQLEVFDAVGNPFQCDSTMKWLFHVRSKAVIFGTCDGPEDKKFIHLDEFIANKGE